MDQTFTALCDAARAEHGVLGATWSILADWLEEQGDARCHALRGLRDVSDKIEKLETRCWQPGVVSATWSVTQIGTVVLTAKARETHRRVVYAANLARAVYGWLIWRWLPLQLPQQGGMHADRLWTRLKPGLP